jgi:hypothetical protein
MSNLDDNVADVLAQKENLPIESPNFPVIPIENKEYLDEKIKKIVVRCENMLDNLESDMESFENDDDDARKFMGRMTLKIAAYNAYSCLVNAITGNVRELRELSKMLLGVNLLNTKDDEEKDNKNIKMSSGDLLKIINNAKENNSMNEVDAEFKVLNEEKK